MSDSSQYSKKARFLLFLLFLTAIFSVYFVPKINLFPNRVVERKEVGQTIISPKSQAEVKAETSQSGSGKCINGEVCDYTDEINYQPVCSIGSGSLDMAAGQGGGGGERPEGGGSVTVYQNSVVEIFELTVPQVLLQGSKYVDDSKKIISYDFPVYRDSQHIILDDEARRVCAPGVDCGKSDSASKISDTPYGVHAFTQVKNAAEGGDEGDGRAVIFSDPKLNSVCPTVQKAKANPLISARYSEMLDLKYQPPGKHNLNRSFDSIDCYRQNPNGVHLEEAKNFVSCLTDVLPTDFIMNAAYTVGHWWDCLNDEDSCRETTIVAIRLDAIFGGVFKCSSPDCEIRYFEYEKLKSTAPGVAGGMIPDYIDPNKVDYLNPVTEPYYITTPCKIRIDKGGVYDVPCLWDMSPYQRQFDIQKSAFMPLDPVMPQTFDEYWTGGVMPELKKRSISCI